MEDKLHHGVGVLFENEEQDQYFVQRKDKDYPIEKYRNGLSFFGGKVEEGEVLIDALRRELTEEIVASKVLDRLNYQLIGHFLIEGDRPYFFDLFCCKLDNETFQSLSNSQILEGEGTIKSKAELVNEDWIWNLDQVIGRYFEL